MCEFDVDTEIDRRTVPAFNVHEIVLGKDGHHLFPAGVAEMDVRAPPPVLEAITKQAAHGVFGY